MMDVDRLVELAREFVGLGKRYLDHIPTEDWPQVIFPPLWSVDFAKAMLAGEQPVGGDFEPEMPEAEVIGAALDLAAFVGRHYFRTTVEGVEHVPAEGAALLVGNHNAGIMPLDALFAMAAIRDRHGRERSVHPLAHDFVFMTPSLRTQARRLGILRACPTSLAATLDAGRLALVYPGGDQDAFRTFQERRQVHLAGRTGFVKAALAADVPVIPMLSAGFHEVFVVVSEGRRLAELFGLRSLLRTDKLPLAVSLPWGLAPAFLPFLPLPAKTDIRFGEPIRLEGSPDDPEAVQRGYRVVEAAMQAIHDDLYRDRRPWRGR